MVIFCSSIRGRGAAKLQEKLRPLEADTLQAVTLGQRPATAREAFQQQHEGFMGSSAGLTGRWRKVKVQHPACARVTAMFCGRRKQPMTCTARCRTGAMT